MIQVREMVKQMRLTDAGGKPRAFSLVVCTADRGRQTGGRLLDLPKVILLHKKGRRNGATPSDRYLLVQAVGTKEAIRLHLDLILYFNNLAVA